MAWYEAKRGGTPTISERTATGSIANFSTLIGGLPMKSVVCAVNAVQSGTGDPSPTNIRPISGWTGANLTRAGKNLYGGNKLATDMDAVFESGYSRAGNVATFEASATVNESFGYLPYAQNTSYTIIMSVAKSNTNKSTNLRVYYTDGTNTNIQIPETSITADTKYTFAFVTSASKTFKSIRKYTGSGTTTLYIDEFGVFEGTLTASQFESYNSTTYSVTWQTEAGTVYGGSIDVTTGVLTDNFDDYDFSDKEITQYSGSIFRFPASGFKSNNGFICSHFIPTTMSIVNMPNGTARFESNYFYFRWDGYTTVQEAEAGTANAKVVFELATPVTYQLTPTEVTSLLGTNNIWRDANGDTTVEYYDGTVVNLDDVMDSYEAAQRPDVPSMIAGSTAFNYSDIKSSSVTIPEAMFYNCANVRNVESPYVTTVSANAFNGCTGLKYISLPECTRVNGGAFSCQRTGTAEKANVMINLPKCTNMGNQAFYRFGANDATAELEFPEVTQIGTSAFASDSNTTSITIKSIKLPKLEQAGSTAFQRMTATTIDIGANCTQLNTTPLANATVTNFIIRALTPPALGSSAGLGGSNMTLTNIYVPDASLNDYKDTTNYPRWAQHSALMHPLSDIEPTT